MRFALTGLLVTAWILLCVWMFQRDQAVAWLLVAAAGVVVPLATSAWRRRSGNRADR